VENAKWVKTAVWMVLVCLAALPAFNQKARAPMVQVENFSIEQGLSHRQVHAIVKDKLGYLWIATENGLNRFDGCDFLLYDTRRRTNIKLVTTA
jgi:ligand-binding sensor domain-containing protein